MLNFSTPNAVVQHIDDFSEIYIEVIPQEILDIMDIKKIYGEFFRQWLQKRINELPSDELINLGYHVAREYEHKRIHL